MDSARAKKLLLEIGYNELPSQKSSVFKILLDVIKEPMLALLLVCALIYLFIGEPQDSIILICLSFLTIAMTFYQEQKTGKALEALKDLSAPNALVIRDGVQVTIPARELVLGDIFIIHEGQRVPADANVLEEVNLLVDEAMLTGESVPVHKLELFSGTLVIQGRAKAEVTATGITTEIGKIGKSLQTIERSETPLQEQMEKLVTRFGIIGVVFCVAVVIIYGITKGSWTHGILYGLSASMSILPEELTVVLIIFFALGSWQIAKNKVLTRKSAAIETLGTIDVLCVDKTGTITQNNMKLTTVWAPNEHAFANLDQVTALNDAQQEILVNAALATEPTSLDPIDNEITKAELAFANKATKLKQSLALLQEIPLTKKLTAITHIWRESNNQQVTMSKGSPEAIAKICNFSKEDTEAMLLVVQQMAKSGLRVIAVSRNMKFMGLLGFIDPLREGIVEAVQECYTAGIKPVMITGDYAGTAQYIGKQMGLLATKHILLGTELTAEVLTNNVETTNIFARIHPDQKLAIVESLKAKGHIVAMTGDGVNDAPALKSSHIGIAMGQRGTDVARETADLVLLNDDFKAIVVAIKLGRKIYDNICKAVSFIISVHIPVAIFALVPILLGTPIVLMPVHIAFLELVIDPTCATVFEAQKAEANLMTRPPRKATAQLLNNPAIYKSIFNGVVVACVTFGVYLVLNSLGYAENETRAVAFESLILGNIALIITSLSAQKNVFQTIFDKNMPLYLICGLTFTALLLINSVPQIRNVFHFGELTLQEHAIIIGATLVILSLLELGKIVTNKIAR